MRKILPSITSISDTGSTWRDKIAEIPKLGISEIALFTTGLTPAQRKECFDLLADLRKSHQFTIPFCHAVADMEEKEYQFLMETFSTERFNLHPIEQQPLLHPLSETLRQRIYIENSGSTGLLTKIDTLGFGGVCLDLSHLFDIQILRPDLTPQMMRFLETTKIGANHISGAFFAPRINRHGFPQCSTHKITNMCQLDYLDGFPLRFYSDFCALELENSLQDQLIYKARVEAAIATLESQVKKAA